MAPERYKTLLGTTAKHTGYPTLNLEWLVCPKKKGGACSGPQTGAGRKCVLENRPHLSTMVAHNVQFSDGIAMARLTWGNERSPPVPHFHT